MKTPALKFMGEPRAKTLLSKKVCYVAWAKKCSTPSTHIYYRKCNNVYLRNKDVVVVIVDILADYAF